MESDDPTLANMATANISRIQHHFGPDGELSHSIHCISDGHHESSQLQPSQSISVLQPGAEDTATDELKEELAALRPHALVRYT
jgi:hypothetical protein